MARTASIGRSAADAPAVAQASLHRRWFALAALLVLGLIALTYSNHFHNGFEFDDAHTIVGNAYIRDLHNIPRFFADARTGSTLPANQTYRPLLTTSFAVDYWLGHGLNPVYFHASTFFWFLMLMGTQFLVYRKLFDLAAPDPRNAWPALFATALFSLHPAVAETVNYIVQRADLYSTLAVFLGFAAYAYLPRTRRFGLFLVPIVIGMFAKQPTAVFPALLFVWIWLFEEENFIKAALRSLPSFIIVGPLGYFVLKMSSASFSSGAGSPYNYRISQPAVVLTYFRRFFLPVDLSADTDRRAYTHLTDPHVLLGCAFLVATVAVFFVCRRYTKWRPVAFGIFWFIVSCAPTSLVPLAEVENDHRLFFPFAGLAAAVTWAATLVLRRLRLHWLPVSAAAAAVLCTAAWGAHLRNIVWHNDETLWYDVSRKSPRNGRGLMNYGLSQMARGRDEVALDYFTRALEFNPYYATLEVNLGVVNGALHRDAEAEKHFRRAIALQPTDANARYFCGRWLYEVGRKADALAMLKSGLQIKPDDIAIRHVLMVIFAKERDAANLGAMAEETLALYPMDPESLDARAAAGALKAEKGAAAFADPRSVPTADSYLEQSLTLYKAGRYPESVSAAEQALLLKPGYAEAWNNIAAAYNCLRAWDKAIAAGEKAVALKPGFQLAINNLALARQEKAKARAVP
jgi:Flp pilus assembly protein TadD